MRGRIQMKHEAEGLNGLSKSDADGQITTRSHLSVQRANIKHAAGFNERQTNIHSLVLNLNLQQDCLICYMWIYAGLLLYYPLHRIQTQKNKAQM